jgi:magnesium-transporting ATPase (P-type)
MGVTGTEVTRQAARMILADDNFATIVEAVREGRSIFDNIGSSLRYLLRRTWARC